MNRKTKLIIQLVLSLIGLFILISVSWKIALGIWLFTSVLKPDID